MAKQKNAPLSSPGLDAVDASTSDKPKRKNSGCSCLLLIVLTVGIVAFVTLPSKPKDPTPAAALAATDAPRAKATNTVTPYPDITMTATQPATFEEEESSLKELPGVISVEQIKRRDTDYFAIVKTHPKFSKESFAGLLYQQAVKVDLYTFRFAVQIDDGESEPLWWINTDNEWSSAKEPPAWVDLSPKEDATATRKPAATARPTIKAQSASGGQANSGGQSVTPIESAPKVWDCSGDIYNCGSFNNRAEMRNYFEQCPGDPSNLDGNADGQYCESN